MNINKSKVTLAAKIKSSGFEWPQFGKWATQDKDGEIFISGGDFTPVRMSGEVNWEFDAPYKSAGKVEVGLNWFQCILSRAEYFHLYPAPDADGWIEWKGGECPVDEGTLIDVRYRDSHEQVGCECGVWRSELYGTHYWLNSGGESNIIAYRLHKPGRVEIADFNPAGDGVTDDTKALQDAVNSMTKPTIEQLAADYRNAKDYSGRKQQEADAAKADAEAKLYLLFNPLKREFEDIADEMIKWLCENGHPHMTVIITNTHAELVEGIRSCVNDSHLKR